MPTATERQGGTAIAAVTAELERLVLDELGPGDQLPSEGQLAASLSVNRLTVREAVRAFEARGLLTAHKGRRPVVRGANGDLAGDFFRTAVRRDPAALFELLEVRRGLEIQIAEIAAERASRAAIGAMEEAVAELEAIAAQARPDEDSFHAADVRFHELLAAATGNRMLTHLVEELAEPLRLSRRRSWQGRLRDKRPLAPVVDAHRLILTEVAAGRPAAAAAAMREHLEGTEQDLRSALKDV